ncbi:TetR/AcrR family transcriptional regulator [Mucilaginibacter gossypii]|uniref:TetR/AcrR family transcriptional regulator n=1 Tax=Mucilaginibacter gossypii TaxID=551996 RepID=UPI000DCE528C|nr:MULTISPECIES: TetR/AcrR family transcriptional regulator [Mucilaginibacter]QTE38376.1 TetR/AcrR family transcriptional regulator [Mucilaginibacter gossypii]RAV52190.1 TetR/AcrR family transcriptional regulator [Mucilaginibacter rubeus]
MADTLSSFRDLRTEKIEELKPRERILKTAIRLFNEHDVHTIGIDRIIAESQVSKRTFYSYFPSKSDLTAAYLEFWDAFRFDILEKRVGEASNEPKAQLLAAFDAVDDWIADPDFNGCVFTRGLSDFSTDEEKPLRAKVDRHLEKASAFIQERLSQMVKPAQAKTLLPQLLSLILGAMVVAQATGRKDTAKLNKAAATHLLNV